MERALKMMMVDSIIEAQIAHYARHGEIGDFDDARRYYLTEASDAEIEHDHERWNEIAKEDSSD